MDRTGAYRDAAPTAAERRVSLRQAVHEVVITRSTKLSIETVRPGQNHMRLDE